MSVTGTSQRAPLAVRAVKAAATTALALAGLGMTLSAAFAQPEAPAGEAHEPVRVVEQAGADPRCAGIPGQAIVRGPRGVLKPVAFEYGWKVYQGKRPGTLVVVCPD